MALHEEEKIRYIDSMGKQKGRGSEGNNGSTHDENAGRSKNAPTEYARWEDVPADVRDKIENRLGRYQRARQNPDEAIGSDRPTDDHGHLDLSSCGIDAAVTVVLLREKRTQLGNVTALDLRGNSIGDKGAAVLAAKDSPLGRLTTLRLDANAIGDKGIAALAAKDSPLGKLTTLRLDANAIGDKGIAALAAKDSPLGKLTTLDLSYNSIGPEGIAALAAKDSPLGKLTTLRLDANAIGDKGIAALAAKDSPRGRLTTLHLSYNSIGPEGIAALAAKDSPLGKLTWLNLRANEIGDKGIAALAAKDSPLGRLTTLDLGGNSIGPEGIAALAAKDSPLGRLTTLHLGGNSIGPEGIAALAAKDSPLGKLTTLHLYANAIGDKGIAALAAKDSPLGRLTTLHLGGNSIGDKGAAVLAAKDSPLGKLTTLHLYANAIGDKGIAALAAKDSPLGKLTTLHLGGNSIGPEGIAALAAKDSPLGKLTTLRLDANAIGDKGIAALAAKDSPLGKLTTLHLYANAIGDKGIAALAAKDSPLGKLTTLHLGGNSIGPEGIAALAAKDSPLGKLTTLHLYANEIGDKGIAALAAKDSPLGRLTTLDLGGNSIGDKGAAVLAAKDSPLDKLTTLNLGSNSIGDAATIVQLIRESELGGTHGGNLTSLNVKGNPLAFKAANGEVRRVPEEALAESDPNRLLAQLLRYAPTADDTKQFMPFYSLRATILGRQEVGKSHLAVRLVNADKLPVDEYGIPIIPKKTADWELHTLSLENIILPRAAGANDPPVTVELRLLDFGGDPDLHSAHRLLLRDKRNFYIVVCDASTDRNTSLMDYWLRIVGAYGSRRETVRDAEEESSRTVEQTAAAVLVLSWCDKPMHTDFKGATSLALGQEHRANLHLVPGYWEPTANTLGTPPKGKKFADAIGEIRKAINECVVEQAHELGVSYPVGFSEVVDAFDPVKQEKLQRKTPLCDGPIPLAEVEAMFVAATGNALDGRTGAELLCNLGLAVCPKLDADQAKHDWERLRLPAAAADAVELTDELVFGSHWLKKLIYKVVRRTDSPLKDERGVVRHDDLMHMLKKEIGVPTAASLAKRVRAILIVNRMIFPRDKFRGTYLVPERLPEADAEAIETLRDRFANASRWTLTPALLLASHLPQFFAEEYNKLASTDALHSSVFRDLGKLKWQEDPQIEALLRVNLNQGTIDIAIRGTDDMDKADRFARSIAGSWARVFEEQGLKMEKEGNTPAKATKTAKSPDQKSESTSKTIVELLSVSSSLRVNENVTKLSKAQFKLLEFLAEHGMERITSDTLKRQLKLKPGARPNQTIQRMNRTLGFQLLLGESGTGGGFGVAKEFELVLSKSKDTSPDT